MTTTKTFRSMAALSAVILATFNQVQAELPDAPDAAIQTIAKELSSGNGGILWEAMPASYRGDVNGLAQLAGSKVDAELYNKGFGLVGRLAKVADKQKTFVFNSKLGGERSAEQTENLKAAWPSIVGFVQTIANSSIASSQGLQSFDGQAFCDETVSDLVEHSKGLAVLNDDTDPLELGEVTLLESKDGSAVLEMVASDGNVDTEAFTKVENRWVPTAMATGWETQISDARAQLEAISPETMAQNKPQVMMVLGLFEGVLAQLEAAQTQEQFDQALQSAMMPIMGLMMQGGGPQGGAPAMPQ